MFIQYPNHTHCPKCKPWAYNRRGAYIRKDIWVGLKGAIFGGLYAAFYGMCTGIMIILKLQKTVGLLQFSTESKHRYWQYNCCHSNFQKKRSIINIEALYFAQ